MSLSIQSNLMATTARRQLNSSTEGLNASMAKLSSGSKVNSARDDAAGLQISNRLNSQSRGLEVAMRNASDAISVLQVTEGAIEEYTSSILRMRDLTLQALNGSNTSDDIRSLDQELISLNDELSRITHTTSFGGRQLLLNGTEDELRFQIGSSAGEVIQIKLPDLEALKEANQIHVSELSQLGAPVSKTWRTNDGDYIELTLTSDESEINKRVEFSAGETVEGVINKLNAALQEKARFFLTRYTDKKGDQYNQIAYSLSQGSDYSSVDNLSISAQHFAPADGQSGSATTLINTFSSSAETGFPKNLSALINSEAETESTERIMERNTLVHLLDMILHQVDSYRADMGATQNRLEKAVKNLSNQNIHVNSSKSQIKDADFAKETAKLTARKILSDSTTSMLAQAHNFHKSASSLLGD